MGEHPSSNYAKRSIIGFLVDFLLDIIGGGGSKIEEFFA